MFLQMIQCNRKMMPTDSFEANVIVVEALPHVRSEFRRDNDPKVAGVPDPSLFREP